MKRILRAGALICAALVLGGCFVGKDTTKIPVHIGFKPVIGHDTRAVIEESVPFPQDRTFNVWALNTSDGSIVLPDEAITYTGNGWLASKKWPEAMLDFTAYWPTDLKPEYNKEKGVIIRNYKAGDTDLLVARARCEYDSDTLVPLHFEHILSRIDFRIQHSMEENIQMRLTKVTMNGLGFQGNYNVAGDQTWDLVTHDETHTVYQAGPSATPATTGLELTQKPFYLGESIFTIPQYTELYFTVEFLVRVGNGEWIPDSMRSSVNEIEWMPSTHYTYTLNVTKSKLLAEPGISNWNNRIE